MGVIKKQAFQSTILLYTGVIIGFITTGILAPNLLTKSEIGTLKLLQSYAAIFMSLGILGFSTITVRFIPQFYDKLKNNYNGFFGLILIIATLGSIFTTIAILIIKPAIIENNLEKSTEFAQYFILIIPLTIFQIYYGLFDSYNNSLYRSSFGILVRDFVQRILVLSGLLLVFFKVIGFDIYAYYYVAAVCLPTILILIHIIWHNSFDYKINFSFLTKSLIGSMVSVGFFGLLNTFSHIAVMQIDTIMLNAYVDSSAVGVYAITFYFGTLVLIPSKALNKIAPTLIAKAYKEDDLNTVKDIYYKSAGNLFLVGVLILLGLAVNLENIFNIIPKSYEDGKYVILLIGLANLFKMAAGSNDSIITYSRYYKMTSVFLIVLIILVISLNFMLIPSFGMTGAAIASCIALLLHNLIKFAYIRSKFNFNPYNYQFLIVLILSIAIYWFVSQLPEMDSFMLEIAIDSITTIILFYLSIRFLPIAREANQFANQIITNGIEIFKSKFK